MSQNMIDELIKIREHEEVKELHIKKRDDMAMEDKIEMFKTIENLVHSNLYNPVRDSERIAWMLLKMSGVCINHNKYRYHILYFLRPLVALSTCHKKFDMKKLYYLCTCDDQDIQEEDLSDIDITALNGLLNICEAFTPNKNDKRMIVGMLTIVLENVYWAFKDYLKVKENRSMTVEEACFRPYVADDRLLEEEVNETEESDIEKMMDELFGG